MCAAARAKAEWAPSDVPDNLLGLMTSGCHSAVGTTIYVIIMGMKEKGFTWVRGGEWAVVGEGEAELKCAATLSAQIEKKCSLLDRRSANFDRSRRVKSRFNLALGRASTHPRDWERVWARPLGLTRYRVSKAKIDEIFDFAAKYEDFPIEEHEKDGFAELLRFLQMYGPLGFFQGHVHDSAGNVPPDRVDLVDLAVELDAIAEAQRLAVASPYGSTGWRQMAAKIQGTARERFAESTVKAVGNLETGEVRLVAAPESLLSLLWMWIVKAVSDEQPTCRYCNAPFTATGGRGRPFAYCPSHRNSKSRKRVQGGKHAPLSIGREID